MASSRWVAGPRPRTNVEQRPRRALPQIMLHPTQSAFAPNAGKPLLPHRRPPSLARLRGVQAVRNPRQNNSLRSDLPLQLVRIRGLQSENLPSSLQSHQITCAIPACLSLKKDGSDAYGLPPHLRCERGPGRGQIHCARSTHQANRQFAMEESLPKTSPQRGRSDQDLDWPSNHQETFREPYEDPAHLLGGGALRWLPVS